MRLAGLDIGFSDRRASCGVAVFVEGAVEATTCRGWEPGVRWLLERGPFDVVAIDGPLMPSGARDDSVRLVERVFMAGAFQRRCKPGASHVPGTGRRLRQAATAAAGRMADALGVARDDAPARRPAVVEAFPNAFLAVCLDEAFHAGLGPIRRGHRFDILYDAWVRRDLASTLFPTLPAAIADRLRVTTSHDERAALVCVMTAHAVATDDWLAVGDDDGGWFHLPARRVWAEWADEALAANLERLGAAVRGDVPRSIRQSILIDGGQTRWPT